MNESDTDRLARDYAAGWNAHDVDTLLSMQDDEMVFHLHIVGHDEVRGDVALRSLYTFFLKRCLTSMRRWTT